MSENEKKSKRKIYAEEGLLNAAFTLNGWFVKLKPAYAIDKMVFCFVKKNTKAAQSFNVYMDLDDFDIWMSDIENFRMKRIIDEEGKAKKTLPEAYKIVTGEKGAFSVGICKSSNGDGYVINGHGKKKENGKYTGDFMNAFVPVSYDWLRVTARYYKLTVKKHYEELSDLILLESSRQHNPAEGVQADPSDPSEATENDNKTNNASSSENKNSKTDKDNSSANKQENDTKPASKPAASNKKLPEMAIDTMTKVCYDGKQYKFMALNPDGKELNIIVSNDTAQALGERFAEFRRACEEAVNKGNHIHVTMQYKNGTYKDSKTNKEYAVFYMLGIATK